MSGELLVLRLVHIMGGAFWVGVVLFSALFLAPTLATMGPSAGQVMQGLHKRKLFTVMPIVAILTVLTGLRLMWITSGGFGAAYFASASGMTFSAGGVFGLIALIIGLVYVRPAAARMAAIMPSLATADEATKAMLMVEMAVLRQRNTTSNNVVAVLLAAGAACMAVARYVVGMG